MEQLNDKEKKLLALCLLESAMVFGPEAFGQIADLVLKLGVENEYQDHVQEQKDIGAVLKSIINPKPNVN